MTIINFPKTVKANHIKYVANKDYEVSDELGTALVELGAELVSVSTPDTDESTQELDSEEDEVDVEVDKHTPIGNPYADYSRDEVKAELEARDVNFKGNASNDTLMKLLLESDNEPE